MNEWMNERINEWIEWDPGRYIHLSYKIWSCYCSIYEWLVATLASTPGYQLLKPIQPRMVFSDLVLISSLDLRSRPCNLDRLDGLGAWTSGPEFECSFPLNIPIATVATAMDLCIQTREGRGETISTPCPPHISLRQFGKWQQYCQNSKPV